MPYKKRRILKSPNKNEEKIRRNNRADAAPLSAFFPQVERLAVNVQFTSKQGQLLKDDHLEYGSGDPITFLTECPGGCADGQMDFRSKIESAVNQGNQRGEGRAQCASALYSGDPCGCDIKVQFTLAYKEIPAEN
jgi:hypothetical protein